jgi:hypothetical protein
VAALTARVTGLELLVASLMAKVAALESAALPSVDPGTHCHDGHDGLFEEAS